ncbi:hypothetical protein AB0F36_32260 [Streptomyces sp. NPDC029080]|uniref:hypothetical protein n=1 Tax=Streptomyces sp. NPDC029080 TaxID=3155017 RepID=UPI0034042A3E
MCGRQGRLVWELPGCQGQLAAHAADQRLSDVGDFDHSTTVLKALPQVGHEFDTVR